MNAPILKTLSALLLTAALAGPAAAMTSTPGVTGNIQRDVQSAITDGSSNVRVSVSNGVATLTGYTGGVSLHAVEQVALHEPGVDSVVNLITQSN